MLAATTSRHSVHAKHCEYAENAGAVMVDVNGTVKVLGGDTASRRLRIPRSASDTRLFIMGWHVAGVIKTSTSVPLFGNACLTSIVAISAQVPGYLLWMLSTKLAHCKSGTAHPLL